MTSEIVITCEGYQDRAFWSGCLVKYFGLEIVRQLPGHLKHKDGKGVYHYKTQSDRYFHVYPCGQQDVTKKQTSVQLVVQDKLRDRGSKRFEHMLVNVDVDEGELDDRKRALEGWIRSIYPAFEAQADGLYALDHGQVSLFCWHVAQHLVESVISSPADLASIPAQQTLERLVCTALCAVYPGRGKNVSDFLGSRVSPPSSHEHKASAMSHMAGWYAGEGGSDFFYENVWNIGKVRSVLLRLLEPQSSWGLITSLAR